MDPSIRWILVERKRHHGPSLPLGRGARLLGWCLEAQGRRCTFNRCGGCCQLYEKEESPVCGIYRGYQMF